MGGSQKSRLLCERLVAILTACVPQLFQQLINTMLCPAFLGKFVCQALCCVPLLIKTLYQNLVLIAEYYVDC